MKRITITIQDKLLKHVLDIQTTLIKQTNKTWGAATIMQIIVLFALKKGFTEKDVEKLKKELKKYED